MPTLVPTYDRLMNPLLKVLFQLGGSASVEEMYEEVIEQEGYPEEVTSVLQNPENSSQSKIAYRLAWARTYLKKAGYLENSRRGVWALTEKGRENPEVDPAEIVRYVREMDGYGSRRGNLNSEPEDVGPVETEAPEEAQAWREQLHRILIDEMTPDAFERLTQRILRESGFIHVEVTGRTGDGGIDGRGIARINGLMSFHIAFQCKKYRGSVGTSEIRDFRGATVGRSDRGLFITTGTFTKGAIEEANRDGVPPIDLIDGEQLADKLKELELGVKTELVEKITLKSDWFLSL